MVDIEILKITDPTIYEMKPRFDHVSLPGFGTATPETSGTMQMPLPRLDDATPEDAESAPKSKPRHKNLILEDEDIIALLDEHNVSYIDNRSLNGALWIIGGYELNPIVSTASRKFGIMFHFKKGGGRATKGNDAWWAK